MLTVWNNNLPVRLLLNESPGSYALRMHHLELGYLLTLEMISGILCSFRGRGSWGVGKRDHVGILTMYGCAATFTLERTFDLVSGWQRICACTVPHPRPLRRVC